MAIAKSPFEHISKLSDAIFDNTDGLSALSALAGGVALPAVGGYMQGGKATVYPGKGAGKNNKLVSKSLTRLGAELGIKGITAPLKLVTPLALASAAIGAGALYKAHYMDVTGEKNPEKARIKYLNDLGYVPTEDGWLDLNTGNSLSEEGMEAIENALAKHGGYEADLRNQQIQADALKQELAIKDANLQGALDGQTNLSNALQQAEDRADGLTEALGDELIARDLAQKQYQGAKEVLAQVLPETPPVFSMPQENSLKVLNNLMNQAQIEDAAINAIRGVFGNGQARKDALGDNYKAVQARVNEILAGK